MEEKKAEGMIGSGDVNYDEEGFLIGREGGDRNIKKPVNEVVRKHELDAGMRIVFDASSLEVGDLISIINKEGDVVANIEVSE